MRHDHASSAAPSAPRQAIHPVDALLAMMGCPSATHDRATSDVERHTSDTVSPPWNSTAGATVEPSIAPCDIGHDARLPGDPVDAMLASIVQSTHAQSDAGSVVSTHEAVMLRHQALESLERGDAIQDDRILRDLTNRGLMDSGMEAAIRHAGPSIAEPLFGMGTAAAEPDPPAYGMSPPEASPIWSPPSAPETSNDWGSGD